MRKSLLAMAALMGVAVLPQRAEAVAFRVAEDINGNMGFRGQIWGQLLGERQSRKKGAIDFRLNNVRLYANGNVGKHMFFGANLDFTADGRTRATDAFVGLKFMDELRVQAGLFRTPFSRAALTDSYTFLMPTGYFYGGVPGADNILSSGYYASGVRFDVDAPLQGVDRNRYRNAGLAIWGEVGGKDVPFKYYLGIFDGPYSNSVDRDGKDNLMYTVRFQFTPTMLGFKGERGYGLRDTQLGRQNVLSFGIGYATQKNNINTPSYTTKAWTVDVKHEQKFGKTLIAGWEAAYFDVKDVNIYSRANRTYKDDRKGFYLQVHAIYDQVVGIGKPGIAIRYDQAEHNFDDPSLRDAEYKRWGIGFNYFLKGQDAQLQLAIDRVEPNLAARNNNTDNKKFTDVTFALQVQF